MALAWSLPCGEWRRVSEERQGVQTRHGLGVLNTFMGSGTDYSRNVTEMRDWSAVDSWIKCSCVGFSKKITTFAIKTKFLQPVEKNEYGTGVHRSARDL